MNIQDNAAGAGSCTFSYFTFFLSKILFLISVFALCLNLVIEAITRGREQSFVLVPYLSPWGLWTLYHSHASLYREFGIHSTAMTALQKAALDLKASLCHTERATVPYLDMCFFIIILISFFPSTSPMAAPIRVIPKLFFSMPPSLYLTSLVPFRIFPPYSIDVLHVRLFRDRICTDILCHLAPPSIHAYRIPSLRLLHSLHILLWHFLLYIIYLALRLCSLRSIPPILASIQRHTPCRAQNTH